MNLNPQLPITDYQLPESRWRDLALYLVVGFGAFLLSTLALTVAFREINIVVSLAVYGLNFLCFAGSAYLFGVWRPGRTWGEFGLRPFPLRWLYTALAVALAFIPVRAIAALIAQFLFGGGFDALQSRLDIVVPEGSLALNFLLTLLGAGVLAPVSEELYFRGLIHRWFWARFALNPWLRVLASSGLFAVGHFDSPGVAVSSLFLGIIGAVAFERSRTLWLPIAIHMVNNSLAVCLLYAALALQPPS